MKKHLSFLSAALLAMSLAFVSCSGSGGGENPNPSPQPGGGNVYVAGWEYVNGDRTARIATLWKNGTPQRFGEGRASSVYVSGNDVYVSIYGERIGSNIDFQNITILKNGTRFQQFRLDYGLDSLPCLFVSGSDVYIAITVYGGGERPRLYKNGVKQNLGGDEFGTASSVFVSGNDVYVAGHSNGGATLWKNGTPQRLNADGHAYSVFVSGNDVYVVGENHEYTGNGNNQSILWKNGVPQALNILGMYSPRSLFVSGSDVYVFGITYQGDKRVPTVLINNVPQFLGGNWSNYLSPESLFVSGNDVYAVGFDDVTSGPAILWKNGVPQTLGNDGVADSVFVK
jgi:hypothetical protein